MKPCAYGMAYLDGRFTSPMSPPFGQVEVILRSASSPPTESSGAAGDRGTTGRALGHGHRAEEGGDFGGDLLVGNVYDGNINAFNRGAKTSGTIEGSDGKPLVNLGLWGIQFGNGVIGTPNNLVFAAGIGNSHQRRPESTARTGRPDPTGRAPRRRRLIEVYLADAARLARCVQRRLTTSSQATG